MGGSCKISKSSPSLLAAVAPRKALPLSWHRRVTAGPVSNSHVTSPLHCRTFSTGSVREALPADVAGGLSKLSDIAKVQLLMGQTSSRVREIWLEQFREKERVVAK